MRKMFIFSLTTLIVFLFGISAYYPNGVAAKVSGTNYDLTVIGTGNPAVDVPMVQDAINNVPVGGKILLIGVFDFGEYGTAYIDKDCEIHGEDGGNTKIIGGFCPFSVGRSQVFPWAIPPDDVNYTCTNWFSHFDPSVWTPVDVTIKHIEFHDPFQSGIYVLATRGLTVEHCRFIDAQRAELSLPACGTTHPESWGIVIWGPYIIPTMVTGIEGPKDPISGAINITDNYFDGMEREDANDPWSQPWYRPEVGRLVYHRGMYIGILCMWTAADFVIERNEIRNTSFGIYIGDNEGENIVRENHIEIAEYVNDAIPVLGGNGVFVSDAYFAIDIEPGISETLITRNTVKRETPQMNFGAIEGDYLSNAIITKNNIDIIGGVGNWTWACSDCSVGQNKIKGEAAIGNAVTGDDWLFPQIFSSNDNLFWGNNLAGLVTAMTYFFDQYTNDNVVEGYSGGCSVIDFGSNNKITGCTPMKDAGGIGQQVRDAMKRKKELM